VAAGLIFPLVRPDRASRLLALADLVPHALRVGLGDHIRCAVLGIPKPGDPIPANAIEPLEASDQGFLDSLRAALPADTQFAGAHHCRFEGRRVIHVVVKSESRPASLVIVARNPDESLDGVEQVVLPSGLTSYGASAGHYRITAYGTKSHLAFVVSEQPLARHQNLASAAFTVVESFLGQLSTQ
jgi:hypothetical protein